MKGRGNEASNLEAIRVEMVKPCKNDADVVQYACAIPDMARRRTGQATVNPVRSDFSRIPELSSRFSGQVC